MPGRPAPGAFELAHPRPGGQQQLVVMQLAAIGEFDGAFGAMDRLGAGIQQKFAAAFGIITVSLEKQARPFEGAEQIGFGQRRPLIGRYSLITHHGDGAVKAFGAQGLHRLGTRLAGANNHNAFGHFWLAFRNSRAGLACPHPVGKPTPSGWENSGLQATHGPPLRDVPPGLPPARP